jgi:predicted kinase
MIPGRFLESMSRRSRRAPNLSESTGKIGQELPKNQPKPLVPDYAGETLPQKPYREPEKRSAKEEPQSAKPPEPRQKSGGMFSFFRSRDGRQELSALEDKRIEVETQPDTSASADAVRKAAAADPKAPKGYVVLAIGLPGSGKTTWFNRKGVTPLSSDLLRSILFDDVEEQRYQGLVFSTLRSLLRARLIAHMPWNYVDATNLSAHERRQWIKMASSFGYETHAVFFDVPLEVCLERNRRRDRFVNEEVMRKMAEKLKPPTFDEGFAKITVVRVKN